MLWVARHRDNPQVGEEGRHTGAMRVAGLLRGVNLGRRQLKMAELRTAVESLGHTDVETYLQSGNVVFTPARGSVAKDLGSGISAALDETVGMDVHVLIRTAAELRKIVASDPYKREDPTKVVVAFLEHAADAKPAKELHLPDFEPEGLTIKGTEIYLDLPGGQARSKLLDALGKKKVFGKKATSRNWRTVVALRDMTNR
jgi:uncharacterized protein (DUF1697 family)